MSSEDLNPRTEGLTLLTERFCRTPGAAGCVPVSFPCETAIWKALPAIRSALARALVDRKVSQRRVAELLSTTEASVSHYIKGKRGSAMMLGPSIIAEIGRLADRIAKSTIDEKALTQELCGICRKVRVSCATCAAEGPEDCARCTLVK